MIIHVPLVGGQALDDCITGLVQTLNALQAEVVIWLNDFQGVVTKDKPFEEFGVYKQGAQLIDFWLKPAVVALGVPLYLQLDAIKRLWFPIVMSQLVGCLVGIVSVVFVAKLCGAPDIIILSMASKSVTTPIAMEVTQSLGGIPSLTAAVVVITGIIGALVGFKTLSWGHVNSPIAQGLSMGAASHAVGASTAMAYSSKYGAFASLGITLNGIFTALLTPTILRLMGVI